MSRSVVTIDRDGLAKLVRDRMAYLDLEMPELAAKVGVTRNYISQLTRGRVGLIDPPVQRKLAAALRVTSVDLLRAAGILTDDDIAEARRVGEFAPDRDTRTERLVDLLRRVDLTYEREETLRLQLTVMLNQDERTQGSMAGEADR